MGSTVFIISIVAIGCGTAVVLTFMNLLFAEIRRRRGSRTFSEDEGQMLQDLWTGIQKMEGRIGNLETILLERSKARDFERNL